MQQHDLRFTKMQGVGNDFVVDGRAQTEAISIGRALAVEMCDRHKGSARTACWCWTRQTARIS